MPCVVLPSTLVGQNAWALAAGVGAVDRGVTVDHSEVLGDASLAGRGQHGDVLRAAVRGVERGAGAVAGRVAVTEVRLELHHRTRALAAGMGAVSGVAAVDKIEVGDDAGLLGDADHGVVRRAAVRGVERSASAVAGRVVVTEVVRCVVRCAWALAAGVSAVSGVAAVDTIEVVNDAGPLGDADHVEVRRATVRRVERSASAVAGRVVGAEVGGGGADACEQGGGSEAGHGWELVGGLGLIASCHKPRSSDRAERRCRPPAAAVAAAKFGDAPTS